MDVHTAAVAAKLNVVYLPLDTLKPDPKNPRRHSKTQVHKLAKSIRDFGFNDPVLIDHDHKVIAGHGRLLAANELGLTEVPTIRIEHLTAAQIRAFQIADNRLAELSAWDDELLAEQLKDLSEVKLDFNIDASGFTAGEIDCRIWGPKSDPADRMPPLGPPVSRPGDLWILGRNRLLYGSPLEAPDYASLMGGERAAMVFTGARTELPMPGYPHARVVMDEEQLTTVLTQVAQHLVRHSIDGAVHYFCTEWRRMGAMLAVGKAVYGEPQDLCVWAKDIADIGTFYKRQHEFIFVFKHGWVRDRSTARRRRSKHWRSNLWRHPSARMKELATKPVAMVEEAIMDVTHRNDVVLDAFVGIGTTLIASERTGRRGFGLDIEPYAIDLSVRRWQAFTGQNALHAVTGKTFNATEAEVGARDAA